MGIDNGAMMRSVLLILLFPAMLNAQGLLRVSGVNPRYLVQTGDTNKAVFLTGDHFWGNLQDQASTYPPAAWPFSRDLDSMFYNRMNLVRLWPWEQWRAIVEGEPDWYFNPVIWYDTGTRQYDLDSISQPYIDRVQTRLDSLAARGMWAIVQLFQGWSIPRTGYTYDTWQYHPFKGTNNVNSISPASADVIHYAPSNGGNAAVWAKWCIYIKRMVDSLQDRDNFVWEVGNEIADFTGNNRHYAFNRLVIDSLKAYEGRKPKQHVILYSGDWTTWNDSLFNSPAHCAGPGAGNNGTAWETDPPDMSGAKVVIADTDHLWGMVGTNEVPWVWKNFCRGNNVILQNNRTGTYPPYWEFDNANWPPLKRAMGVASTLRSQADLVYMTPSSIVSTSSYELAGNVAGHLGQVIVFQESGTITVDLTGYDSVNVKWIDPDDLVSGTYVSVVGARTAGGASRDFTAPDARYDVLYLSEGMASPTYLPWKL